MDKIRYRVVNDNQGGSFGMYRDYTLTQWKLQALEWCFSDDNLELAKEIYLLDENNILDFIRIIWDIEFEKVEKIEYFDTLKDFEDESLDEYYFTRFEPNEDEIRQILHLDYEDFDDFWDFNKDKIIETVRKNEKKYINVVNLAYCLESDKSFEEDFLFEINGKMEVLTIDNGIVFYTIKNLGDK